MPKLDLRSTHSITVKTDGVYFVNSGLTITLSDNRYAYVSTHPQITYRGRKPSPKWGLKVLGDHIYTEMDNGFRGTVVIPVVNLTDEPIRIEKGDLIGLLTIMEDTRLVKPRRSKSIFEALQIGAWD